MDQVRILDLVSEHVMLKRVGKRWVGLCPFHSEKTPSFTVNPDMGIFKCFGCGKGGDIFSFIQSRENVPFMEAMRALADRAGVELTPTKSDSSSNEPGRSEIARVNEWALRFFRENLLHASTGQTARQYVLSRGISDEACALFSVGLATDGAPSLREAATRAGISTALLLAADLLRQDDSGRVYDTFRNRLMFPIRDATRRVVGFGGRTLADDRAKYLNTRQTALFDKGHGLYGIDLARDAITKRRRAVIVEGYTDCIAAHQAGFTETVATLGTALTDAHVELLRRYAEEMILLFDSDQAGEAAADRAIAVALPRCVRVRLARIPDGKDPCDYLNSLGGTGFSDILKDAVDALEFKWIQTCARFHGDTSDGGRRQAVLDFLRVVSDACATGAVDVIQRGLLVNQVAHLLRMDRAEVGRLIVLRPGRPASVRADSAVGGGLSGDRKEPAPSNEEQAAWLHLLEIVLAEPGILTGVDELPDVQRIVGERERRIARVVVDLASTLGEFRLMDVLARCGDSADAERATQLAQRGAERGNREAALRGALERICRANQTLEMERSKGRERLLRDPKDLDANRKELAVIAAGAMQRRHFSPRRLVPADRADGIVASPTPDPVLQKPLCSATEQP